MLFNKKIQKGQLFFYSQDSREWSFMIFTIKIPFE